MKRTNAQVIQERLRDELGIDILVEETAAGLRLTGTVESPDDWQMAKDVAAGAEPYATIDNRLIIEPGFVISETLELDDSADAVGREEALESIEERLSAELADRRAEPLLSAGFEEGGAATPPVDPVIERGEVLGGFQLSSMDDVEIESSVVDDVPGDEALAEAIRQELHEDASTCDLEAEVRVESRVAHLSGRAAGPEDVENAEAVTRRVPGVTDVIEEFTLSA